MFKKFWKSLSHNHTLKFLADPVKPFEKVVSTGYTDVKGAVGYAGKHLVGDVDGISSSISTYLPLAIGGVVVVMALKNR